MRSALDRRQAILEVLSDRRFETIDNLASEFNVDRRSIRRDIEILSCSAPIFTVKGRNGGVRVMDGYYYGNRYLNSIQEDLLKRVSENLDDTDKKIMQSILTAFVRPNVERSG